MDDPVTTLRFDPTTATVVRTPPGAGYGYWVGGHKLFHDAESGDFVLFYRERTPLERSRGGICRVARSTDGVQYDDVWEASKDELAATSIEVGHCVRDPGGEWRLYLSYEFAGDGRWRIDVLRGDDPSRLDTQGRRTVLSPGDYGLGWIKDPWIAGTTGGYSLMAAVPARTGPTVDGDVVHAAPLDATVLAESGDGLVFPTVEYVFEAPGDDSWHGRRARLNSVLAWDGGLVGFYDGGRTFYDNYEEWCGIATGPDLHNLRRVATEAPWVRSPHGCVRYVHAVRVEDTVVFAFEYTRDDGSHDLRVAHVEV